MTGELWKVTARFFNNPHILRQNTDGHIRHNSLDKPKQYQTILLTTRRFIYIHFSPIRQEYPFLQESEIFLSRPAISA